MAHQPLTPEQRRALIEAPISRGILGATHHGGVRSAGCATVDRPRWHLISGQRSTNNSTYMVRIIGKS